MAAAASKSEPYRSIGNGGSVSNGASPALGQLRGGHACGAKRMREISA